MNTLSRSWLLIFFCLCLTPNLQAQEENKYSFVKIGEVWCIEHEIVSGETLYSLARSFDTSVDDIKRVNIELDDVLSVGEFIYLPVDPDVGLYYTVSEGETLFSISRLFDVKVEEIQNWNDMEDEQITEGLTLVIYRPTNESDNEDSSSEFHEVIAGESLYSISRQYGLTIEDLMEMNDLESNELSLGQRLKVDGTGELTTDTKENKVNEVVKDTLIASDSPSDSIRSIDFEKIEERGMAEVIESGTSTKYLALHRTAPKGTILTVINELNNQVAFVRVIGTLPETGANEKLIVKISPSAWKSLGAVNKKLRVKVSYVL